MLHAILFYLILHSKVTYKIYPDQIEVRDVIIVSPEEIFVPENIEEIIKSSPFIEDFSDIRLKKRDRFSFKAKPLPKESETLAGEIVVPEPGKEKRAYAPEGIDIEDITGKKVSSSDLTSKFKLKLPLKIESELPEDYKLDLSRTDERIKSPLKELEKESAKKDINLLKYLYSDYSNIRLSQARSKSGRYATGSRIGRGKTSFHTSGYDISSWAEKVVNKIQKNWIIPSPEMRIKGLVGISVIIEKNGELSSIQMVNSSSIQALDEAALRAIRMSSPFPDLPDNFPNKNLEVYLEFLYDD